MEQLGGGWGSSAASIRLPDLSPAAAAFVRQHPQQARVAITAALEAAAAQLTVLKHFEPEPPESLRPHVVEPLTSPISPVGVIGVDEAVKRLGVSRATIYNWIEAGRLIGWRLTRRGTYIPAEQIVGPGEVVGGIDKILELIPDPRAAWRFLDVSSEHVGTSQRPIDALKAGRIAEVVAAAGTMADSFI
jgi:excisionase family DNA binding protein